MEITLNSVSQRQENPDLQELPESAPAGIRVVPLSVRMLVDDNTLFMSTLLHALHATEEMSDDERILSKSFPQSLQEKRYIGILILIPCFLIECHNQSILI